MARHRPRTITTTPARLALVGALALAQLVAASAVVVRREHRPSGPVAPAAASSAASGPPAPEHVVINSTTIAGGDLPNDSATDQRVEAYLTAREAAASVLLNRRAKALDHHDRAAFLSTVDSSQHGFYARQAALFDAITAAPVGGWSFTLHHGVEITDVDRSRVYHFGDDAWAPEVHERYRYLAFDQRATERLRGLIFAKPHGTWQIEDDDGTEAAKDLRIDLWDFGPVMSLPAGASVVVGHRGDYLVPNLVALVQQAVDKVSGIYGPAWSRRAVVLVPRTQTEFGRLIGEDSHLSEIGAVASRGHNGDGELTGQRIIVNPREFRSLANGVQRVILAHELTHVATRDLSDLGVPEWLIEGYADYVGFRDSGFQRRFSPALTARIRSGRAPDLPADAVFDKGTGDTVADAYHLGQLACAYLARRLGDQRLTALYAAVAHTGGSPDTRFFPTLARTAHLTREDFERGWVPFLRDQLNR